MVLAFEGDGGNRIIMVMLFVYVFFCFAFFVMIVIPIIFAHFIVQ